MKHEVLVVGAHPDDIEIGAGGTVLKLVNLGYDVAACILTSEPREILAEQRKAEARKAASLLGIPSNRLLFLDLPDGMLSANRESVRLFREHLERANVRARLVLTHSLNDSHNDHRAAAELVIAAFRSALILHFGCVNSLITNSFKPRVYINIDEFREEKLTILDCFRTQDAHGRIKWEDLEKYEKRNGDRIAADYAEAFEITTQRGAEGLERFLLRLNDSPFNQFWHGLLGERKIVNLYSLPRIRQSPYEHYDIYTAYERKALTKLRKAFNENWIGDVPLEEYSSYGEDADLIVREKDIFLEGGPVTNQITLTYFNHIPHLRYVIDYDVPNFLNIRIKDRHRDIEIFSDYGDSDLPTRRSTLDKGIVTLAKNPMAKGRTLVGAMGIHAEGTAACIETLCDPFFIQEFLGRVGLPFQSDTLGCQVLIAVDCKRIDVTIDWDSLHVVPY